MIRILLADDHRLVREGLRHILEMKGDMQVAALAANGREAMEQARLDCLDIAVLDVSMPIMDGLEAAEHIHESCPHTRILMLSMYDTAEYVMRALAVGADGYVLKDAAGEELVEAVRSLARGEPYFSPRIAALLKHL